MLKYKIMFVYVQIDTTECPLMRTNRETHEKKGDLKKSKEKKILHEQTEQEYTDWNESPTNVAFLKIERQSFALTILINNVISIHAIGTCVHSF